MKNLIELIKNHINESNINHMDCYFDENEVVKLLDALEIANEALRKIAKHETLDGDKYNSYCDGWFGVAEFAAEAQEKIKLLIEGDGE
jgi:hypothetical protein